MPVGEAVIHSVMFLLHFSIRAKQGCLFVYWAFYILILRGHGGRGKKSQYEMNVGGTVIYFTFVSILIRTKRICAISGFVGHGCESSALSLPFAIAERVIGRRPDGSIFGHTSGTR